MRRLLLIAAVSSVALASCGGCGPKPAPAPPPHSNLSPIPDAPVLKVAPETLPGAAGEVAVVAARPQGAIYGDDHPTITFSQPMVAIESVDDQKSLPPPATISPAIAGEWRWLGSTSVELVPSGQIPYGTEFKVIVPAGLTALSGKKLDKPYTFTFQTPRPEIAQAEPGAETVAPATYNWLTPDQKFTLLFNQPVRELLSHTKLTVDGADIRLKVTREVDVAEETRQREDAELAKKGETRHYERQSFAEKGFKNQQTRYELAPETPLPLDKLVTLTVDRTLRGKQGPLTMGADFKRDFRTYGPMKVLDFTPCGDVVDHCNYGPAIIFTSNEVDMKSLKGKVSIEPHVEVDWDHAEASPPDEWTHRNVPFFSLPGKFRPGTEYTITIAAGAVDVYRQPLPAAKDTINTADLEPYFNAGESQALLERSGDGALPIESANLKQLDVATWKLSPAEMAAALGQQAPNVSSLKSKPVTSRFSLEGKANLVHTKPLPIRDAIGGSGLFAVRLSSTELSNHPQPVQIWGQVTDLAVHAKLGATSGLVWVTRLSDGSSVSDAAITLWSRKGAQLWSGTTDADGLAKTPGLSQYLSATDEEAANYRAPFALVSATKGDDTGITVSSWTGGFSAWSYRISDDWEGKIPKSRGMVFSERGIYRPGDTAYVKGLLRFRRLGALAPWPAKTNVEVTITSPENKEISKTQVTPSEYGTFDEKVAIPANASLGEYRMQAMAVIGTDKLTYGGSFWVEAYRAPQFMVDVTTPHKDVVAGDALEANLLARYLFGGTMADADVTWSVNRSTTSFTPPGNEGFTFGANVWGWDDDAPSTSSDVFASGVGKTDRAGVLAIKPGKAEAPTGRTYTYTIEGEVADISRQRVADRIEVIVHPAASYAGLRSEAWFAEVGKPTRVELVAVDPKGARQSGVNLDLKVVRRDWKSIRKKGVGDQWIYEDEKVDTDVFSCSVKSAPTAQSCSFTPADPGLYVLAATATDDAGRKSVSSEEIYAIGGGWVSWKRNEGDKLDLVADKPKYDIGDTARVLVKSPYPEADAVVTVERDGVMSAHRVHLKGAATALDIPIDESLVPNAYVGVVLVRGRVPTKDGGEDGADPGRPAVRVGYTELSVEKKSKRLTVTVRPDAKEKRPRDKVRVDLAVNDWKGKGTPAEVTVWAVDEGVLRLTRYTTPDPIDALHPKVGLSVRIGEPLLHLVARRKYGDKGEATGGSGGDDSTGSDVRRAFKTTAAFAPTVMADADGKAHLEFDLPDNLTTFRIMAVAVTKDDRFGDGESSIQVAKPILALPALPRFARVGDKFEAGVVVHSTSANEANVTVSAKVSGLTLAGPAEQTVQLTAARPKEARFQFTAEHAGTATLTFRVTGGSDTDAVEEKIPVELPVGMEAVAVYGDTKDTRGEAIVPPTGIRTDVGGVDVTLASSVLGGFSENMRQLVDYPYGCLEQLSSRLIPFVELRKLQSKMNVAWQGTTDEKRAQTEGEDTFLHQWFGGDTLAIYKTDDPDVVINTTLSAIANLQNHDGGFKLWSDSWCSDEWLSSYATLVLKRASDVGYKVDPGVISRGQDYLANTVAAGRCTSCGWSCTPPGDATRINALYTLARTGKPKASYYGELFARREKLPLFAQAMLDDAIFVGGGDREQGRQLFQEILNHAKETPKSVHFEEVDSQTYANRYSSDPRTTSIVLQTMTDLAPDHPYVSKIAHYLADVRQGDGRFRNTQEAAFALMALSEVVATKEKDTPDFDAKATLGKTKVASAIFKGRSMDVTSQHVDMAKLSDLGSGKVPFDFSKKGDGVLYYGALLRYAPSSMPTTALDRGMVVQRWFEPWLGGGQIKEVHAGDLVRVRVRIGNSQEHNWVAIEVPLPAGLETVNTALATSAHEPTVKHQESDDSENEEGEEDTSDQPDNGWQEEYAHSFWSPFNHTDMRDDKVVLFADHLPPGVHVASFVARATTPGEFVLMPANAQEMYAPEVFGRSEGGTFKVTNTVEVAQGE